MKKFYLTMGAMLAIMSIKAQIVDDADSQWLLRNPASPLRAERIIEIEKQQILDDGTFNIDPYAEPSLSQIPPSLQPLQYFFEGQRELFEYNAKGDKEHLAEARARYQRLFDMHDPAYEAEAQYYLGYIDYLEGDFATAEAHFKSLPADSKYNKTVPFYEMQMAFLKGDYKGSAEVCNEVLGNPNRYSAEQRAEAARILAESALQMGDNAKARANFNTYLEACSEPLPGSAYNAAVLEYRAGQFARAAQLASLAAQSNDPQLHQSAYMLIGQAKLALGQTSEARMAFEQAVQGNDAAISEAAAFNICSIAHEKDQSIWGDEISTLENFLNTYPVSRYADRVSAYLSEAYTTTRNYEAALASINKIKQPNNQLLTAKQRLLNQLGAQHYVNGEYQQAEQRFTESISMGNLDKASRVDSYFWRGESRYQMKRYDEAAQDYTLFIGSPRELQSDLLPAALYNQGYAYLKQQNYAEAINSFNRYVGMPQEKGTPAYYDGMVRLADCYYYTRQFVAAEDCYKTVVNNGGNQADYALYQEALMLGLQKKYQQKQATLDRLITSYPQSEIIDDAWLDKGRTAMLTSDNKTAVRAFSQIIDNYADSPIAPQAAVQLAMTYNNMGETAKAQQIYQLVAERYPGTDAAVTAAEDLKTLDIQQRVASLPTLFAAGKYQELLDTYEQLLQQNVSFRDRQNMQLLAAKSHIALGQTDRAKPFLTDASSDMRTSAGAEAKFLLAQMAFDAQQTEEAQTQIAELTQSGTSHQYWLARAIVLMSDMYSQQGENFTAAEYLKSLLQNYTREDDGIRAMASERLSKLNAESEASNETPVTNETTETL
ncbi:MAG: tetratricopeptide repeat protein [Bacteroidales bacterium]|nr:tetratricopeptide repeat protein [Bacteroidales bacterium]